jgi:ribosome-binding protein aMBF1 (putative translation factor)
MSKEVGEITKNARLWHGLSQHELSDEIHTSQSMISAIERGRRLPGLEVMIRMGSVLGNHWMADIINQVKREMKL